MTAIASEHAPLTAPRRILRDGLILVGLLAAAEFYFVLGNLNGHGLFADGLVYWAVDPSNAYRGATVGGDNAYLYSPAIAQLFSIIGHLPREIFVAGWTLLLATLAVWLARPWPAALLILLLPVSQDVAVGNIHVLLAVAVVLGFRWPAAWAFVLLTKATPGVGLVWFAARREWRSLLIAATVTAGIVALSVAVATGPWRDWIALLRNDGQNEATRLIPRIIVAAGICAWGGLTGRYWTVPLSAMLAAPVIWSDSFAMLLGCVAVSRWPREPARPLRLPGRRWSLRPRSAAPAVPPSGDLAPDRPAG